MSAESTTALVTGGTSGIGRAVAEAFAAEGRAVLISGRDQTRGLEVVAGVESAGGRARFLRADLGSAGGAGALAEEAGEVDVLVNNAGVFPFASTDEMDELSYDEAFAVNVKAPFLLTAAIAPEMASRGSGAVVNVSTMVASFGLPGAAAYAATKAAVESLTRTWAAEYGPRGVRVNAVAPGPTRTPGTEQMGEGLDQLAKTAPVGRPAGVEEIAAAIVFLASQRASYINGAVLAVDGGRTAV